MSYINLVCLLSGIQLFFSLNSMESLNNNKKRISLEEIKKNLWYNFLSQISLTDINLIQFVDNEKQQRNNLIEIVKEKQNLPKLSKFICRIDCFLDAEDLCKKFDKYLINQELQEIENSKDDVLFSLLMEKILKNYLIFYGHSSYIKNLNLKERQEKIQNSMKQISVKFQTYFKDNTEKIQYFDQVISTFCKTIQEYQEELDERTNINSQFNNEENYINENEEKL